MAENPNALAAQHAAVAEFGRFALESRTIQRAVERAVEVVAQVLGAPLVALLETLGPGKVAVVHARGPMALAGEVWRPDSIEIAPPALSAAVVVDGHPWGQLIVADDAARRFEPGDLDFVQSMATVLAAALERERLEGGRASVAALGRYALESRDIELTMQRAVDVVTRVLEAPMGAVIRRTGRPGMMTMVQAWGPVGMERGQDFEIDPALEAEYARCRPLRVEDWADDRRFPSLAGARTRCAVASMSVPVSVEGRDWGRLIVADSRPRRFTDTEAGIISSVAELLAASLEREHVEQAHAAVETFSRWALSSRDIAETGRRAVDEVTRALGGAMGSLVRMVAAPGRFALVHGHGPLGLAPGEEFDVPPEIDALHGSAQPISVSDWRTEARFPPVAAQRAAGIVAALSVPVLLAGRPWGRLSVFCAEPREFTATERDVMQSVAHVLAAALERDRIESRLRRTAEDLQRTLLPTALPVVPGIELVARYAPARGGHVGGDWYDVLALPQGGVGLVMGDVEGHDSIAAAVMGQIRNVLRAYASEGHTPAEVVARVNRFVAQHSNRMVSCCYAELRPGALSLTWVSAGHPAPLLLRSNGQVGPLAGAPGQLLGLDPDAIYTDVTTLLPVGSAVLMVTDGLVDDRPDAVHRGLDAFTARVRALDGRPIDDLADALVRLPPGRPARQDDAALLVVRLVGTDPAVVDGDALAQRVFRPAPESTPAARRFVRDILAGWDLTHLEQSATLAVSELVTNTVLHTASAIHLTLRRTGQRGLWIGVYDDSDRFARLRRAGGDEIFGRGLVIVDTLADAWGVTPTPGGSGKTVWLELTAATAAG